MKPPTETTRHRPILCRLPKLKVLGEGDIERVHDASMRILERTGVVFAGAEAVNHFRGAGAKVEGQRVRLDENLVRDVLASAPAQYTLKATNPAHHTTIGGDHVAVMPGGGPAFVLDLDGNRRPGRLEDVENFARLGAMTPEIQVIGRKSVEAQDVPVPVRHLECWRAVLRLCDKPVQSGYVGGRAEAEDALEMLAIVHGGEAGLKRQPVTHCSINVNSPLTYDEPMVESLIAFAKAGQVAKVSPFVMAGISGPTTLAGAIAQQNAEVLAGLVLAQLVRPGVPVLYGAATSNLDMRTAAPAIGSPESGLSIAACAQLARYYRLPCRTGGTLTDSPVPDEQAQYESMFTLLISVLAGANFLMHGAGVVESYLTLSYEQFVFGVEQLAMVERFVQTLAVNEENLALDAIHAVGPGGYFLESSHTLARYRNAFFEPRLSVRQGYEQWMARGGLGARERARRRCQEWLESYAQPRLDRKVEDALHDFVEREKSKRLKSRGA